MGWSMKPSTYGKNLSNEVSKHMRSVALRILGGVIADSPVDTGRFRGNWVVGIGRPNLGASERTDKSGATTISVGSLALASHRGLAPIYINNNLPYAERLNNGHSKQAPPNFVEARILREVGR